jgi:hypothetical protein
MTYVRGAKRLQKVFLRNDRRTEAVTVLQIIQPICFLIFTLKPNDSEEYLGKRKA